VGEELSSVCLVFEDALTDLQGGLEEFGVFGSAGFEPFDDAGAVPVALLALPIVCVSSSERRQAQMCWHHHIPFLHPFLSPSRNVPPLPPSLPPSLPIVFLRIPEQALNIPLQPPQVLLKHRRHIFYLGGRIIVHAFPSHQTL